MYSKKKKTVKKTSLILVTRVANVHKLRLLLGNKLQLFSNATVKLQKAASFKVYQGKQKVNKGLS